MSESAYSALPEAERPYFRPVAENRNIVDGRIIPGDYLFYPYTHGLAAIDDEAALKRRLPTFYASHLLPHQNELAARVAITSRGDEQAARWWDLNRHRPWLVSRQPKIVTSYFGQSGSFAWDVNGDFVIVQGHGWWPTSKLQRAYRSLPSGVAEKISPMFFAAYLALLNSDVFTSLIAEFCPHVAGGQFNLSKRFIESIPLPDLPSEARDTGKGMLIFELEREGQALSAGGLLRKARANEITALLYGVPADQWPLS